MNIGYDASRSFNKNRTGTENYSYQLLIHLSAIDHINNYYIFLRPGYREELTSSWPDNFHFITIPYKKLWTQIGLAKQTFSSPKLDLLFIPAHTLPLIRQPGLKTVVTVHDLGAEYLPKAHQLKQRLYLKLMTRYQIKSATHIIAVSGATKNDLIKRVGIPDKKISVVYEGYNQNLFQPLKGKDLAISLQNFNLVSDNYFLFVGTIQPRKNLERLIKAYAKLRWVAQDGAPLVLAGSRGWLSDEIYKLPKQLGIEDHFKFLGYVPDEKLPALYSGAKALLYPSLFEGFGLPILEAMACGCPVLTSNSSSLPEVGGSAVLYVNPYSIEDIAKGIKKISQKNIQQKLIVQGFKQKDKFSWEKAAQETLQVFQKIATKSMQH